ncbi:hypothetical protein Droror1_Dr00000037 [Drosera rotundifolia]
MKQVSPFTKAIEPSSEQSLNFKPMQLSLLQAKLQPLEDTKENEQHEDVLIEVATSMNPSKSYPHLKPRQCQILRNISGYSSYQNPRSVHKPEPKTTLTAHKTTPKKLLAKPAPTTNTAAGHQPYHHQTNPCFFNQSNNHLKTLTAPPQAHPVTVRSSPTNRTRGRPLLVSEEASKNLS